MSIAHSRDGVSIAHSRDDLQKQKLFTARRTRGSDKASYPYVGLNHKERVSSTQQNRTGRRLAAKAYIADPQPQDQPCNPYKA